MSDIEDRINAELRWPNGAAQRPVAAAAAARRIMGGVIGAMKRPYFAKASIEAITKEPRGGNAGDVATGEPSVSSTRQTK